MVEPQSQAASKAPIAQNSHGAIKLMGEALGQVALRPEQRAEIEKLAADAEARHAPLSTGRKELMLAFADQVEKGAVDRAALQPKLDQIAADFEKSRNDDRAALVKLHDLLDKQQRNDFVDALEKNFKGKRGFGAGAREGEGAPRMGFGHMRKLTEDLKLTDDQRDKIKDAFKESWKEGMKDRHDRGAKHGPDRRGRGAWGGGGHPGPRGAWGGGGHPGPRGAWGAPGPRGGRNALDAFREDKLDLDRVAPAQDRKAIANGGVDQVTKMAEKILPILTPEQRKIAADKLREMANGGDTSLLVH